MQSAPRGLLGVPLLIHRFRASDSVHHAIGLRYGDHGFVAEERIEIVPHLAFHVRDVFRIALICVERSVLVQKYLRGLPEGFRLTLRQSTAESIFALEAEIPILGEVLRLAQAFLLGADSVLTPGDRSRNTANRGCQVCDRPEPFLPAVRA